MRERERTDGRMEVTSYRDEREGEREEGSRSGKGGTEGACESQGIPLKQRNYQELASQSHEGGGTAAAARLDTPQPHDHRTPRRVILLPHASLLAYVTPALPHYSSTQPVVMSLPLFRSLYSPSTHCLISIPSTFPLSRFSFLIHSPITHLAFIFHLLSLFSAPLLHLSYFFSSMILLTNILHLRSHSRSTLPLMLSCLFSLLHSFHILHHIP